MKKETKPFIILGILHLILLVFTIMKKKQKVVLLLWSAIGPAYLFEYFVLNMFKMYQYKPKVFKNKWFDNVFGAFLSQCLFVPIKATALILFRLSWKWKLGASVLFSLIERFFIYKGIYKNVTWRTYYTVTLMFLYFLIIKKWWEALKEKKHAFFPITTLFFAYLINYTNAFFFIVAFFKGFLFQAGFVKNKYQDHFLVAPLYAIYLSIIGTINSLLFRGKFKVIGLLLMHGSDHLLVKYGILKLKRFNIFAFIPIHIGVLFIGQYTKSLLKKL